MASLTVRNIPEDAKLRFRKAAAALGRSMEEHLRALVIDAGFEAAPTATGVRDVSHNFRHFVPAESPAQAKSRARIEHLIALGRGLDIEVPARTQEALRDIDFS